MMIEIRSGDLMGSDKYEAFCFAIAGLPNHPTTECGILKGRAMKVGLFGGF